MYGRELWVATGIARTSGWNEPGTRRRDVSVFLLVLAAENESLRQFQ